jgi:sugar/nucleoside kinase (ribokinase family)
MSRYDLYGLGNALVDMEFSVDDSFLRDHGITKGHMTLVDAPRIEALLDNLSELSPRRTSGGSAANTLIAAQAFGSSTFYSCRIGDDETGRYFVDDLAEVGVGTNTQQADGSDPSGRCLVLITPDAERSMNTFLGISEQLTPTEIDPEALRDSRCLYIEGYLSSSDTGRATAVRCRELAESEQVRTALTLSDPSMVEIFREGLIEMLGNGVDHLFCNEEEALTWAGTDRIDIAVKELKDIGRALNITLGARGSLAVERGAAREVPGFETTPIDTNGAGDIYAGAVLHGWCAGMDGAVAASFGNFAAAHLVAQYGARLSSPTDYQALVTRFPGPQ